MDKDTFNRHMAAASAHPNASDVEVTEVLGPWPIPLVNVRERHNYLGVGFVTRVRDITTGEEFTTTVAVALTNGQPDFKLSCPSTVLVSGARTRGELDLIVNSLSPTMAQPDALVQSVNELHGRFPANGACNYTNLARRNEICSHIAATLAHLAQTHGDVAQMLITKFDEVVGTPAGAPSLAGAAADDGDGGSLAELERYAFQVPVMMEGDHGSGKTHDGYALARKHSYPVVLVPGHEGVEAPDMLGYMTQAGAHGFVWLDGGLARAFRLAKTQKVVLFIDEILRIPQRQLSVLLTAFTPDEYENIYRLPTGRVVEVVDGVATTEVLTCPVDNLCIIATTNVGAGYAVEDCDPALRERFHVVRRDTDVEKLKKILGKKISVKGWAQSLVDQLVTFYTATVALKAQGNLQFAPNTRTLSRALRLARTPAEIGTHLYSMNLLWVARNAAGKPVVEQQELVRKAVERTLSVTVPAAR